MSASAVAAYGDAVARLHWLVRHRDALRSGFERAWRRLPKHDAAALEDWASAAVELIEVNAGPACQLAFWSASAGGMASLRLQAASGRGAAAVCRHAGARAALACLEALPGAMGAAGQEEALRRWWQGMERLAREAADCVAPAARHTERLLADRSGRAFADFVAAGLKAYAIALVALIEDARIGALAMRRFPGLRRL